MLKELWQPRACCIFLVIFWRQSPLQPSERGQQKSLPTIVRLSISFSDTQPWAAWSWHRALSPPSCSLVFSLLLRVLCGFLFTCQEPLSPPYYKCLSCSVPPDLPFLCHPTSPFTPAWTCTDHFVGAPKKGLLPFTTKGLFSKATVASCLGKQPNPSSGAKSLGLCFFPSCRVLSFLLSVIHRSWLHFMGCGNRVPSWTHSGILVPGVDDPEPFFTVSSCPIWAHREGA